MQANNSIYKRVQVTRIIRETANASTFELTPLDGWQPGYQSGQFITLVFTHHGTEERRSYSFSSAPELHQPMRITIKRVVNGMYSRHLLDHTQEGDIFITSGISGYFRLPEKNAPVQQLFFLAAGSGITPVYALLQTALHTTSLPVTLVYSNRSEEETIFLAPLQQLQQQYPQRLSIEFLNSSHSSVYKSRLSNWLLLQLLKKLLQVPLAQCAFYLCGPFEYMRTISITLLTEGTPAANIKKEDFSPFKPVHKPQPPDITAHQVEIQVAEQVHSITVQYPQSILAAAKSRGIVLPYSCEAGRCGSCTATCTRGDIWMAYNEVLMDDEIAKGRVLTCQGYPINGDATIQF
ncbi:ring-1,2-phenylacetyl-CoA epoxidase subunit PaaE [Filimonas lacunae]|uniref:Ring-1,2-phenylacetyl-CoA epoxidase subunit PaaE n=1 Tax=Filimonas lacunae TaxID=477680 RepID=A0A173MKT8_9BACT|nr:iron-sulfur cluster-binding domain-containing protein [Filimonas lacunae]BAV08253.1 flavodoxin reductases (ferredoxin-NADPH reductases) family 1 [Filimonas lacunae]SIT33176.1 ring-1,2-phenylacetyl-CoA epoxidase subunit PaaE [Filimonas lacunae]